MCDRCRELDHRILLDPVLARKILESIEKESAFDRVERKLENLEEQLENV